MSTLNQRQGKAAEYIVASQILLRGGDVSWPAIDTGYDLIGPNGCKVQVKSAHLRCTPAVTKNYPEGVYTFGLVSRGNYRKEKRTSKLHDYWDKCDILVFWGIEHNRFWIAPSYMVEGSWSVVLGPDSSRAFESEIPKIKELLAQGLTQEEVGRMYGVGGPAICTRLQRAGTPMHSDSASFKVRKCENAWGYILNYPTLDPTDVKFTSNLEVTGAQ